MSVGLGIRAELFEHVFERKPALNFFEAHSENYFGQSIARQRLLELRQDYAISLHGVGLSLGRADGLDQDHLHQLKQLVQEVEPILVSEHLSWSALGKCYLPDLLPLPLTRSALGVMCEHIQQMQDALQRQILVENPSNYLRYTEQDYTEAEFLNALCRQTGCGLLLDVNNVAVSAHNTDIEAKQFIEQLGSGFIGQYHLAGYTPVARDSDEVWIDTHNHRVYPDVWQLFEHCLATHAVRPTLIEWDSDFPEFEVLLDECQLAALRMQKYPVKTTISDPAPAIVSIPADSQSTEALQQAQRNILKAIIELEDSFPAAKHDYVSRAWIYQGNVFNALYDYLAGVYPATQGVLGKDYFRQLAIAFAQQKPSERGNIHEYGTGLIAFAGQQRELHKLLYLNDLMRYEWALHQVYYAEPDPNLKPASYTQDLLFSLTLTLCSHAVIIASDYPLMEIHRQSLPEYDDEVAISLDQSQHKVLVFKKDNRLKTQLLTKAQWSMINQIATSGNLLMAIENLQGQFSEQDLSAALAFVFEAGIFREAGN